jgi:hypothetical protein
VSKPVLTTFLLACAVLLPLSFLMPAAKAAAPENAFSHASHGVAHR